MAPKEPQAAAPASWRNSGTVCAYSNGDRHLGHIVRAHDGWVAFDATHTATHGNSFRPLGFFRSIAAARDAVESATEPLPAPAPGTYQGTVV